MAELDDAIRQVLVARADVRLAYVFGSTVRGQARASSDVDVAVLFEPEPGPRDLDSLTTDLQMAAGRAVDLVVLNTAPPLLAHRIIKDRAARRLPRRERAGSLRDGGGCPVPGHRPPAPGAAPVSAGTSRRLPCRRS
jgi:predicted nucleotidyltransferase